MSFSLLNYQIYKNPKILYLNKKRGGIVEKTNKIKIFYLHANSPQIAPISGDKITEVAIIRSLSKYFDVYYNNQLIDFNKPHYGQYKQTVEKPDKKYDIYWVRNNYEFLKKYCDGIKVSCGCPYDPNTYKLCDAILTYTYSWTRKLLKYNRKPEPSTEFLPKGKIIIPKRVYTVPQSVEDRFYKIISGQKKRLIRKKMAGEDVDFIIGYFGRFSSTCNPRNIIDIMPLLINKYKNKKIRLYLCGNKSHFKIEINSNNKNIIINKSGITHNKIHEYIQSVDLIISNYTKPTSNWVGCMHILEAAASETPILCGDFDVRKEKLGENYPLFWNYRDNDENIKKTIFNKICSIMEGNININIVKKILRERSKKFKIPYISSLIRNIVTDLIKKNK